MKFKKTMLIMSLCFVPLVIGCGANDSQAENNNVNDEVHQIYEQAVKEGKFNGTYEEWLDSIKGDTGPAGPEGKPGQDGIIPHIGSNGNWFLGDEDTGVKAEGADGKTIEKVELSNKGYLSSTYIITFDDGTTKEVVFNSSFNTIDYDSIFGEWECINSRLFIFNDGYFSYRDYADKYEIKNDIITFHNMMLHERIFLEKPFVMIILQKF